MSILQGLRAYYGLFGFRGLWVASQSRLMKQHLEVLVSTPCVPAPLHLRVRSTDISTFSEVILRSEYDWQFPTEPKVIIDAGANIGLSAVFFAHRYPNARVFAVEPEPRNFELLKRNTVPYANIVPIQAAIWGRNENLTLTDPGLGDWGFRTLADDRAATTGFCKVPGITADQLMADFGITHVDVLKIDIEGAELEVFETCSSWIRSVGTIVIELHDRFRPGCTASFEKATTNFRFREQRGELTVAAQEAVTRTTPDLNCNFPNRTSCRIVRAI